MKKEEEYNKLSLIKQSNTDNFNSSNKKRILLIKNAILLLILLILLLISNINIIKSFYREVSPNTSLPIETYTSIENGRNMTFLTKEMVDKFNLFVNYCINDTLIDKKKYPLIEKPKISVIMPIYNGGKYLHYSLRSIQNQKMKDIEIILIDDCSTDDTLTIIEKYMKEDERIRLIKNFENRKILYSKSIGALNSKGKYIIELDQDDIFIRDDVFDILYYEAEKDDLDLVQIRDIVKHSFTFQNKTRVNYGGRHHYSVKTTHYKLQPELKDKMFFKRNNCLLWGLLIKSDIYKKVIHHLWPIIINYKIIFNEDYTISFMLLILSQKYKYLNNFALIHLANSNSASNNSLNNIKYYISVFFFGNTLLDYHINNNPKDIGIFNDFYSRSKSVFLTGKNLLPNFYNFLINKVIKNDFLSSDQKGIYGNISNIEENIDNFEYETINNYQIKNFNNNISSSNLIKVSDPKISIIIFCIENKHLDKTINSIQNQNFTSYEIILIYDNNEQSDINLIQKLTEENPNINLINNKNKKGIIYSISLGVLSSKGKYILILEPSNTLSKQNTLNELYNFVIDENIDILEFNLLINYKETISKNSLILYKCNHFKSEIDLDKIKYNKNYTNIDLHKELLINKLIKAEKFKNIIKQYNINEIQREVYNYYDNIFLYILQKSNNNFNHINTFGVIKNINNSNSLNINNIIEDKKQKINDSIFYINFIFENSYNTFEAKEFVVNEFFNIMSIIYNKFNYNSTESYNLYEKFINCQYITQMQKNYLQFYYNSLIN